VGAPIIDPNPWVSTQDPSIFENGAPVSTERMSAPPRPVITGAINPDVIHSPSS
jgi:hypothetical protein